MYANFTVSFFEHKPGSVEKKMPPVEEGISK
jgi:hypothetical protein